MTLCQTMWRKLLLPQENKKIYLQKHSQQGVFFSLTNLFFVGNVKSNRFFDINFLKGNTMLRFNAFKYGGASIENASSIKTLSQHVHNYMGKRSTIVVVSAMKGKTTEFGNLASALSMKDVKQARELWQQIFDFHMRTIANLFPSDDYCSVYNEICKILTFDFDKYYGKSHDIICGDILPIGELISSMIISRYFNRIGLNNKLVDARDYMVTSEEPINAEVLFPETEQGMNSIFTGDLLQKNPLIITQGFIGKSANGRSSTLGREGSDLTAALLGIILEAENLGFWKMRGVYGNPEKISREEFKEIEESGAKSDKLLYDKCLDFLIENNRDFWIINSKDPNSRTLVC
jgi:aspartate kinase